MRLAGIFKMNRNPTDPSEKPEPDRPDNPTEYLRIVTRLKIKLDAQEERLNVLENTLAQVMSLCEYDAPKDGFEIEGASIDSPVDLIRDLKKEKRRFRVVVEPEPQRLRLPSVPPRRQP